MAIFVLRFQINFGFYIHCPLEVVVMYLQQQQPSIFPSNSNGYFQTCTVWKFHPVSLLSIQQMRGYKLVHMSEIVVKVE